MAQLYKFDTSFSGEVLRGASCAFGVFDGVHVGHQFLLDQARATARENGGASLALTFDIDPDEVFRSSSLKKLMTNEERIHTLLNSGIDGVVVFPFSKEFASLEPFSFLDATFNGHAPAYMHVGSDFRFGARAKGSTHELETWGKTHNMQVAAHHLKSFDGTPISATRIRELLAEGKIKQAAKLLGHSYTIEGVVVSGRKEGRVFGFKTANLAVNEQLLAVCKGVYAARAYVRGRCYKAAVNVGIPPTFAKDSHSCCEAHILDFDDDIYGETITIEFCHFLRPEQKFASIDELIQTVNANIDWVRKNL